MITQSSITFIYKLFKNGNINYGKILSNVEISGSCLDDWVKDITLIALNKYLNKHDELELKSDEISVGIIGITTEDHRLNEEQENKIFNLYVDLTKSSPYYYYKEEKGKFLN